MDKDILHHARLATLMLYEQVLPEAIPDAARVHRALTKLAAFGRAIEEEQLTDSEAAALVRSTLLGATVNS